MAYLSEQGRVSDFLRELAANIDDGLIDVLCVKVDRETADHFMLTLEGHLMYPGERVFNHLPFIVPAQEQEQG